MTGNLQNDCISILNWVYRNQGKHQSYRTLENELNIPLGTLHRIIKGFEYFGESHWALATYAKKYGYSVTYVGIPGELIWVDRDIKEYESDVLYDEDGSLFHIT